MRPPLHVGIHSVGLYLPDRIRNNDWWPEATVEKWRQDAWMRALSTRQISREGVSRAGLLTLAAMAEFEADPFLGGKARRIRPDGMLPSDMEIAAARDALERAQVSPLDVGFLMVANSLPDYFAVPTAPRIHQALGLPQNCLSFAVDSSSESFHKQLALAESLILQGPLRFGLLVQSCGSVHLTRPEDPHSAWFGDMATAVVVGPVQPGRGLLGQAHRTDGNYYEALVGGVPGAPWHTGPVHLFVAKPDVARKMLLNVVEMGQQTVEDVLAQAGAQPSEVDFYACHQATAWFRAVTQECMGLSNARSVDFYPWAASVGACNVPLGLALGEREGLLGPGQLVVTYAGGSGVTWSSVSFRWGK